MRKTTTWLGKYKGVNYEIKNFDLCTKADGWAFYLVLPIGSFPASEINSLKEDVYYTSYGTRLSGYTYENPLNDLEWHGGMTYYEYKYDEPFEYIKAGCDYQHIWDDGQFYDENIIEKDVEKCIDSLFQKYKDFKTIDELCTEFRSKFPQSKDSMGRYDKNGNKMEEQAND